jgi:hypothetical protein
MSKKRRKKKARITKRQAKLRQKKKKPNRKFKRLQQKVENGFKQKGISTDAIEFRESPDGVKMSEVILKLAEPLLKKYGDIDKRIRTIISLTIFEWNRLLLPEGEREKYQDKMMDTLLPPDENAETVGSILYLSDLIAERRRKYFPDIKKVIVDYELIVSDGNITLNISSAPIESSSKLKPITK